MKELPSSFVVEEVVVVVEVEVEVEVVVAVVGVAEDLVVFEVEVAGALVFALDVVAVVIFLSKSLRIFPIYPSIPKESLPSRKNFRNCFP